MGDCARCGKHTDFITEQGVCYDCRCAWCHKIGGELFQRRGNLFFPMSLCNWCAMRYDGKIDFETWYYGIPKTDPIIETEVDKWKEFFGLENGRAYLK